ncbi:hypothetical protein [uncultured Mailhella sp.]|uniref:hypothetical protein n=1 Tax=uncultured Mailhella sp. TaxID=1981031 RepID=UPI0025DFE32E|nr:hypothetical protein [uncultured Mailhella sp.]
MNAGGFPGLPGRQTPPARRNKNAAPSAVLQPCCNAPRSIRAGSEKIHKVTAQAPALPLFAPQNRSVAKKKHGHVNASFVCETGNRHEILLLLQSFYSSKKISPFI